MKIHPSKSMNVDGFKPSFKRNYRDLDNYNPVPLMEEIKRDGCIFNPIHVCKETGEVLQGNRRFVARQRLLADPSISTELRESLAKMHVILVEGMTETEHDDYMLDDGTSQSLNGPEVVKAVWRQQRLGKSELEIMNKMFQSLARYTGSGAIATEVARLEPGEARNDRLMKWLHGTVGDKLMTVGAMGEFMRDQLLLTEYAAIRALSAEEKARWKFKVQTARVGKLRKAKLKDGDNWTCDKGGVAFNAQIEEFIKEDTVFMETGKKAKKARVNTAAAEQTGNSMENEGIRLAFLNCAGKLDNDQKARMVELDSEYLRRDKVFSVLASFKGKLNGDYGPLVNLLLEGNEKEVETLLASFVSVA